jgi:hypothetical protein
VIVSFTSEADAQKMRKPLVDRGCDEEDVHVLDTARVLAGTTEDLKNLSPIIKALGNEGELVRGHREGARFTISKL